MSYDAGTHRSSDPNLTEITNDGPFGGIFACAEGGMYGDYDYTVTSPRHLTNFELNYSIEGAWEAALELCDGDESLAEAIMTPGCEVDNDDNGEAGMNAQFLRGQLAASLGFTSVEMEDENGHSVLCLPGCSLTRV